MGSHEINELRQGRQKISSHEEQLHLFFEIQKRDRERKIANKMYDVGASAQAPNYEYMNSSECSPLAGGSAMEAQVVARLASSSFYHGSKPILRYASKRNNADLLTFDVGKTDYDWLKTPPVTPFNNSIDYSNDATLENSNSPARLHILALLQEVDAKNVAQRLETLVIPNNITSSSNSVAVADADCMPLNRKSDENGHTKLAISSSPFDNTTRIMHSTDDGVNRSQAMSNKVALSNLEMKTATHANDRDSSVNSLAKGYSTLGNPRLASKESLRSTNPTSRFSELPSIVTNLSTTSHAYKGTAVSTFSTSTTPKADTSSNAKRSTVTNAPSRMPTTPTKQSKVVANNGGKTRPTSRGRGAINISGNTGASRSTNKAGKDSKSTSSSRQGSPEIAHAFSELPGFTTEAPPNLRTTVSTRSTSTTRSSRSTSNSRGSRQPTTPTNRSNNNDNTIRNTSRSTSASKVRSTSMSKSSDVKTRTDGTTAIASKTSRASNNKGAVSSNILGSSMVDKVIQARRAAASTPSTPKLPLSSPLSTSSSSGPLLAASSSSLSLKSTPSMSSSLSISSTSSLLSLPSTLSTSSSLSSPPAASTSPPSLNTQAKSNESRNSQLRHKKDIAKQQASSSASISPSLLKGDTNSGFNSSRLNQSSKARPMPRSGEAHQSEVIVQRSSEVRAKPLRNLLQVEDTIDHARQINVGTLWAEDSIGQSNLGNAESRNVGRKPREVERQYQKQQQYQINEASSDFSNELNEIMRQDIAHYQYGAFPPKDILNMGTSKNPTTTIAKEVEHKHKNRQLPRQMSEDSSDFSSELNAIMRQDTAHYHASAFPSKDIMKVSNNWMLNSPDCSMRDDSVELMHLFMCGIEKYGISESPLVCQHGAPGNCDKCNNVHGKGFKSTTEVWKASPLLNHSRFSHKHPNDLQKRSPF